MKTTKHKKENCMAVTVLGALGLILSSTASAEIKDGYFSVKEKDLKGKKTEARVFIKTSGERNSAYGLILHANGTGALFRVEELPDGTQAWLPIFQKSGHFLGVNEDQAPALKGSVSTVSGRASIRLVPTQNSVCKDIVEIEGKESGQQSLGLLPDKEIKLSGERGSKGLLTSHQYQGSLVFDTASHEGSFSLNQIAPGLATLRARVIDSESINGWSVSRDVLGLSVMIHKKGCLLSSAGNELVVVNTPEAKESCAQNTVSLTD
ncbi:MAG: hypothetical protein AABZ06_05755 [Bdellovibrionota bacterium]